MNLPEAFGGLPGDANALAKAARALRDQASELADQSRQVADVTRAGTGAWSGPASDMWRRLGLRHQRHLTTSASALGDAASALDVYARKLEDAQHAHDSATAEAAALRVSRVAVKAAPIAHLIGADDDLDAPIRRADAAAENAAADGDAAARIAAAAFREIAARAPAELRTRPSALPPNGTRATEPNDATLTLLLGSVRIGPDGKPVPLNLHDPASVRGADAKTIDQVARAQGWTAKPAKKGGGGTRYFTPGTNGADGIRVMNGDPKAPPGIKQGPYAIITRHGEPTRVALKGNPTLGSPGAGGPWTSAKPPTNTKPTGPVQTPGKSPAGGARGTPVRPTPGSPIRIVPRLPW